MSTIYQFRVEGYLDKRYADWFGRMTISYTAEGDTLLTGEICDQAALYGFFSRCRDLGLTLISVNPLSKSAESKGDTQCLC